MLKTANLGKSFFTAFFVTLILSSLAYWFIGKDSGVIVAISLMTSFILTGIVGLENTIITLNQNKGN